MMNDKIGWEKIAGVVFILCIICFVIFNYFSGKQKEEKLNKNHRYTAAVLTRYSSSTYGQVLFFLYNVGGREIKNNENITLSKKDFALLKDFRFYVMFSLQEPKVCKLFLNLPVPDSIKEIPQNGWEKIPVVDCEKVKRYDLERFKE